MISVSQITIRGFKSIRDLDHLKLNQLNVLIGANGVGKSNFITFFRMLRQLAEGNLQFFTRKQGGPDTFLYHGRKETEQIAGEIDFPNHRYSFTLDPATDNHLIFSQENLYSKPDLEKKNLGTGHEESQLLNGKSREEGEIILSSLQNWVVYHFHDTGETAGMKGIRALNDNLRLRSDAENLAPFLYILQKCYPDHYRNIRETVQMVFPSFGDFHLRPLVENENLIQLEWKEKGKEIPFMAHALSDGTLRFICLATLLLQPEPFLPDTILVDEPELGLHPYAIRILSALFQQVSEKRQVIISTQSRSLVDEFEPEDLIVVEREHEQSIFRRPNIEELEDWLED